MKREICWEDQNRKGRHRLRMQGGWYSCLLLFCGAMACVFSAYRQACDMFVKIRLLALPERFWGCIALAAAFLAAVYGSGKLKYWWLRLLPMLPAGYCFYRYYEEHRLAVEDGSLYIARSYLTVFCRHYKLSMMFPLGIEEQAPGALLFWSLLLLTGLFILAAAVRRYYLLLLLPLAALIAGLSAGCAPGWISVLALLAAALVLGALRTALPDEWHVRTAQLAGILCICIIAGQIFAASAERVVKLHNTAVEKQTALEDALLRLPVWELFKQNGAVSNQSPGSSGREVLSIRLSGEATENIYLRDYAASHYENGKWTTDEQAFFEAAAAHDLTSEKAGEALLSMAYEADEDMFDGKDGSDYYAGWHLEPASPRDYIIECRGIGTSAPIPYVSRLPEKLDVSGDAAVKKPWNLKSYGGSLMLGGSRQTGLPEYLQTYFLMDAWYLGGYSDSDQETQPELQIWDWYGDLAMEAYAKPVDSEIISEFTEQKARELGYYFHKDDRDIIWRADNASDLNSGRLVYGALVQYILQAFGTYSQKLDPLPEGADPIDYFLTTSEKGYCVHYASAAVLMLQDMGVPARYASGYVVFPDDFAEDADGYTAVVTDLRAHAWAEIYLEGFGWVPLEVTPGYAGGTTSAAGGEENADDKKPTPAGEDFAEDVIDSTGEEQEPDVPKKNEDGPDEQKNNTGKPDINTDTAPGDGGILDEELLGAALHQWFSRFAGLLAGAFAVWLIIFLCRSYRRRQEELLRRELKSGQYKAAINRMNRRIYRRLRRRHFLKGIRISDDGGYRFALERQYGVQKIDADAYMRLVKEAYFSGGEMCAEDAETVYRMYLVVRDGLNG